MNYDMQPIVEVMDEAIFRLNKMKKTPQRVSIRRYLEAGGKLTSKASRNFWECERLASRINNIKNEYYDEWLAQKIYDKTPRKEIKTEMVKTESGKRIAEYSLKKLA